MNLVALTENDFKRRCRVRSLRHGGVRVTYGRALVVEFERLQRCGRTQSTRRALAVVAGSPSRRNEDVDAVEVLTGRAVATQNYASVIAPAPREFRDTCHPIGVALNLRVFWFSTHS